MIDYTYIDQLIYNSSETRDAIAKKAGVSYGVIWKLGRPDKGGLKMDSVEAVLGALGYDLAIVRQGSGKRLGKEIMLARSAKGWTRDDLADASGVSDRTIEKIENEKHSPTVDTVQKLLKAMGYRLEVVRE